MFNYALIENGQVVSERSLAAVPETDGIKLGDDGLPVLRPIVEDKPPLRRCQGYAAHSYTIEPNQVVKHYQLGYVDLDQLRAEKLQEIESYRQRLGAVGITYQGRLLQLRDSDLVNFTAMGAFARFAAMPGGPAWPPNFGWIMADNSVLPLPTPADMVALADAAQAAVVRLRFAARAHKDAIALLSDPDLIESYDFGEGW